MRQGIVLQYNAQQAHNTAARRGIARCDTAPAPTIRRPAPATRPGSRPRHDPRLATTRPRACGLGAPVCTWVYWLANRLCT